MDKSLLEESSINSAVDRILKKVGSSSFPTSVDSLASAVDESSKFSLDTPSKKDTMFSMFITRWLVKNLVDNGLLTESEEMGVKGVVISAEGKECMKMGGFAEYIKTHPKAISYDARLNTSKGNKISCAVVAIIMLLILGAAAWLFFVKR